MDPQKDDKEEEIESLGGKPTGSGPEGSEVIETIQGESTPTPETTPGAEKEKVPESPSLNEQVQEKKAGHTPPEAAQKPEGKTPNIVDQTDTLTNMKHIKKPGDKLTEEADVEEERFIEEVEKHHGLL